MGCCEIDCLYLRFNKLENPLILIILKCIDVIVIAN